MSVMAPCYEDLPVRPDGFTVDDLAYLPDDGRRYELFDGVLIVSPAPRWQHQRSCLTLASLLDSLCPPELMVFSPTPDVVRGQRTSLQPDVCVARRSDLFDDEPYRGVPVLAVEVLSPSSADMDWLRKRHIYASLGVASYWVVDLAGPSVTVFDLVGDAYSERATVYGGDALTVDDPFPVTIRPADLKPT
jgi:Uma2 family endonuclease